ncbi:MAG TPA: carboxypeptidase-like regulatory domain-containing protein, partial [Thermoanaerobaculia bacterium]|nr:carboxypeptidase-like regulatory domain-containing protein [Thermoanaerobaculia bacterium]
MSPGRFELHAVARGFAPARRTGIEVGAGPEAVELGTVTLEPGAVIEGVVTDGAGNPIAGAEVTPRSSDPVSGWFQEPELPSPSTTGADGRFRIVDLRRGDHVNLEVQHPGYAPAQAPAVEVPTPEPLHVELKAARSLAGRILGPRGEPVPGALLSRVEEVRIGGGSHGSAFTLGQTGADGIFRVTGLAPGTLNLEVSAGGYQTRRTGGVQIPEDRDVEHLDITLEPGVILAGRVLDKQGEPVGDASIWVHPERPADRAVEIQVTTGSVHGHILDNGGPMAGADVSLEGQDPALGSYSGPTATTDDQGRFELSAVGPGTYRVTVRKAGAAPAV